jgi:hypothetical protein
MKKIIYTLIAIGFAFWGSAQNIDVNFRVTSRTATQLTVDLEARSLPATTTIGKTAGNNPAGGFQQVFTYNSSALSFASGSINGFIPAGWPTRTVNGATAGSVTCTGTSPGGAGGANTVTVPITYQVLATIVFNIVNVDQPLDFAFGASSFTESGTSRNVANTFDKVTFNGSTWTGGNGTAGAPAAGVADLCKDIEVTSGAAEIDGDVQCDYIVISGGTLTVNPGASIEAWTQSATSYSTTAANFILDADASGYAQFLGGPVELTARQYWDVTSGGRWINLGFPVSGNLDLGGAPINTNGGTSAICVAENGSSNIVATTNIYEFTAGNNNCSSSPATVQHEWSGLTGNPSAGAQGYNIFIGGGLFPSTGIISAEGSSLTSASYSYTHAAPHAADLGSQGPTKTNNALNYDGWRLVANPFPCNLDVAEFLATNSLASISIGAGFYSTQTTGTIAPFQGFWIKTGTAPSSSTINFTVAHRVIGTAGVTKTNTFGDHVALHVTFGNNVSEAQLVFDPNTTKGYDQMYDGFCFINRGANIPNIAFHYEYTATPGNYTVWSPMHMNYVPAPTGPESYPLLFANKTSGNHTLAIDATVLPSGYSVFVEDLLLAPGTLNDITNTGYSFNHAGENADPLRFVLHLNNTGTVGLENYHIAGEQITAWFSGDLLSFGNLKTDEFATVVVTDLAGRTIATGNTRNAIAVQTNGMYVVRITQENGQTSVLKVVKK